jgi:hypothetical protein
MSRARVVKYNYIQRQGVDVVLAAEAIESSRRGYTPGIQDELVYQLANRTQEILRLWNTSLIYGSPSYGVGGSTGAAAGDYSTMAGIHKWLDGTFNTTSVVDTWQTASTSFPGAPYANGDIYTAINDANIYLFRQGAVADWLVGGPLAAVDVGKTFNDRIRLQQDEMTRGFAAQYIRTTLANELRVLLDGYVSDTSGTGDLFLLDSSRWRVRPYAGSLYYTITAETLRDGDQVRALSKLSLEGRNTGSDIGQASILISGCKL